MPITAQSQHSYTEFVHLARDRVQADFEKGLITESTKQLLFHRYLDSQLSPNNPYWVPVSHPISRSDILAACQYRCSEEDEAQALSDFIYGQIWKDDQSEELLTSVLPTELSEKQVIRESLARFVATNPLDAMSYFKYIINQAKKNPYQKPNVALRIFLDTPAYKKILGISLDVESVLFHVLLRAREYKLTPEEIQNYASRSYAVADKLSKEMQKFPNRLRQHHFGKLLLWILSRIIHIRKSPSKLVIEASKEFELKRSWKIEVKKKASRLSDSDSDKNQNANSNNDSSNEQMIDPAPRIGNQSYQEIAQVLRETSFLQARTNGLAVPVVVTETLTAQPQTIAAPPSHPVVLSTSTDASVQNALQAVIIDPIPVSVRPVTSVEVAEDAGLAVESVATNEGDDFEYEPAEEAVPATVNFLTQWKRDLSGMIASFLGVSILEIESPAAAVPPSDEPALPAALSQAKSTPLQSVSPFSRLGSPAQQIRIEAEAFAQQQLSRQASELFCSPMLSPIPFTDTRTLLSPGNEHDYQELSQTGIDRTMVFTGDRQRAPRPQAPGNTSRAKKELIFSSSEHVNPLTIKEDEKPPVAGYRFCSVM